MLLINWIRVKRKELKIKLQLFSMIEDISKYADFATKLIGSCKDMTGDELRKEVISAIAEKVHEDNKNKD